MIATGNGNLTDLVGDAVFDTAVPTYEPLNSYDGERDTLIIIPGVTIRTTPNNSVDHQIPTANAVTYGGMFWLDYTQQNSPYIMCSSSDTGFSPINYGIAISGNLFHRVQGGPTYNVIPPREVWFHMCIVENPGRTTSKLYLDGKLVSTKTPVTPGTVASTDVLQIGQVNTATNGFVNGFGEQFFVMAAEYNDAQVHQLAENAYGHVLPL